MTINLTVNADGTFNISITNANIEEIKSLFSIAKGLLA